ncbi:hypothetical protein Terro_0696 [Terriglobus roseus DSM 18391]|uniref:Uncharacterized protein n=1 Tax=Terriglobus roseus (strain DSM 18391 / NRRL B-41598 / KBS 63) TaxID=926566 RepID=I3ZCR3_TERRK|nr:hypothetical protein [Terriglobus roseus]AFL87031.1 hypothetical protein Terro_0696 [Terriglobus roseus DSM 18391]
MTLLDAPAYNPRRQQLIERSLIAGGVLIFSLVILTLAGFITGHGWLFSNLPIEHRVNKFFTAIENKDFATAYGLYQNDPKWQEHAAKYSGYPLARFTEDWTKYSPVGPILSHHVDKSVSDGTGTFGTTLLVATTINGDKEKRLFLAVQRSDGTFTYPAPHVFAY